MPRFTIRLNEQRDQDLVSWLENLGKGERSVFIRQALRKAISEKEAVSEKQVEPGSVSAPVIKTESPGQVSEAKAEQKTDELLSKF